MLCLVRVDIAILFYMYKEIRVLKNPKATEPIKLKLCNVPRKAATVLTQCKDPFAGFTNVWKDHLNFLGV